MKNNMFMALSTSVLNGFTLALTSVLPWPDTHQGILALSALCSPFLSIWLLKIYIRADDPPELTRTLAGLESCIKTCKHHLKDPNSSDEFKRQTRAKMEEFQIKLQSARLDFEQNRMHTITQFALSGDQE